MVEVAYTDTGEDLYWMSVPRIVMMDVLKLRNVVVRINDLVYYVNNVDERAELKVLLEAHLNRRS